MTTPFWLNAPSILLHPATTFFNIWPSKNMDKNEKLNSITRMIIVLTLLGFFYNETVQNNSNRNYYFSGYYINSKNSEK